MSQTIPNDFQLFKELHAFGREWIGVARGDDAVWAPLHRVESEPWRAGFMFMGVIQQDALRIHEYKHGITRRCLSLDVDGKAYAYTALAGSYVVLADVLTAVERVFEEIERFGATRETTYDAAYQQRRDQCLAAAGYHVVGISDRGVNVTNRTG